jgi:hypothetical protein
MFLQWPALRVSQRLWKDDEIGIGANLEIGLCDVSWERNGNSAAAPTDSTNTKSGISGASSERPDKQQRGPEAKNQD